MRLAALLAFRFIRRRGTPLLRTSALAALTAVALGVAALVVVLALMTGYRDALRSGILAAGGHLTVMFPGGVGGDRRAEVTRALLELPGVESAGEVLYAAGLAVPPVRDNARTVTLKAPEVLPQFLRGLVEPSSTGPGVAVGEGLARALGVRAGDRFSLQIVVDGELPRVVPVTVASLYRTGFAELDDQWVVVPLRELQARLPSIRATGVEVRLSDPERAAEMSDAVANASGESALVTTWQESNRNLFAALRWQKLSLGVVLSLVLCVGAIEVAAALVVLVTEKRRALGILLAIGGQPRLVRRTLQLVGACLGGVGVLLGVGLGVVTAAAMTAMGVPSFSAEIAEIYMVDAIPLHLQAGDLLIVISLGLVEVVLAASLPARRAAASNPVEVLRWV